MRIIEQYSCSKGKAPSEDLIVIAGDSQEDPQTVVAVIDGATPKTSFRLPDGETPGHFAARIIGKAIEETVSEGITDARTMINRMSETLRLATASIDGIDKESRPTASVVMFDSRTMQVIQIGDCPFATMCEKRSATDDTQICIDEHRNEKLIDHVLSEWRSSICHSYMSRAIGNERQMANNDPGRRIIQHFITRQTRWQNADPSDPYAFGVIDGSFVPDAFIRTFSIDRHSVNHVILASDGIPKIHATLKESLDHLHTLIAKDPLCIDEMRGTKGINPNASLPDDVSYVRVEITQ